MVLVPFFDKAGMGRAIVSLLPAENFTMTGTLSVRQATHASMIPGSRFIAAILGKHKSA
jgi:hypothetical protein